MNKKIIPLSEKQELVSFKNEIKFKNKKGKVISLNAGKFQSGLKTKDARTAIRECLKELSDDKKLCCVYTDGDDPEPCTHASDFIKKTFKKYFGGLAWN